MEEYDFFVQTGEYEQEPRRREKRFWYTQRNGEPVGYAVNTQMYCRIVPDTCIEEGIQDDTSVWTSNQPSLRSASNWKEEDGDKFLEGYWDIVPAKCLKQVVDSTHYAVGHVNFQTKEIEYKTHWCWRNGGLRWKSTFQGNTLDISGGDQEVKENTAIISQDGLTFTEDKQELRMEFATVAVKRFEFYFLDYSRARSFSFVACIKTSGDHDGQVFNNRNIFLIKTEGNRLQACWHSGCGESYRLDLSFPLNEWFLVGFHNLNFRQLWVNDELVKNKGKISFGQQGTTGWAVFGDKSKGEWRGTIKNVELRRQAIPIDIWKRDYLNANYCSH